MKPHGNTGKRNAAKPDNLKRQFRLMIYTATDLYPLIKEAASKEMPGVKKPVQKWLNQLLRKELGL